jgi:hypothetical protein
MKRLNRTGLFVLLSLGLGMWASAKTATEPASLDAVAAAPGNHRVLFENDRVRVLDVQVPPGTREPVHEHRWPGVLYILSRGKLREYDGAGHVIREEKDTPPASSFPLVTWLDAGKPHAMENLDAQPIHIVRFELKQ